MNKCLNTTMPSLRMNNGLLSFPKKEKNKLHVKENKKMEER